MKVSIDNVESLKIDEKYSEEKDPTTPYLNPEYRIDLYENSCANIVVIVLAILGLIIGVFSYFLILFVPIACGEVYHNHMWWAFLIIFIITLAVLHSYS